MKTTDGMRLYSALPKFENARTWAEIDLNALRSNYEYLRDLVWKKADAVCAKRPEPICVVKADAYGHGAIGVVPALLDAGCRFFAVSSIEEAAEVRNICRNKRCDARILILGITLPELAPRLAEYDIIAALPSLEYARKLSAAAVAAGVKVRTHIKLDTGMNRIGFAAYNEEYAEKTADEIACCTKLKGLSVEGMFTHFAEADDDDSDELENANLRQAERFAEVSKRLKNRGVCISFCHMCNSAAAVRFPQLGLDGVRLGISLYGVRPSQAFDKLSLVPVMSLKTVISHIHTLPAGEKVSYGGTFSAAEDRVLATLPIGYADGFLRSYGGASVKVFSEKGVFEAPVVGRICMDQCMVDVTEGVRFEPHVGDEVTIFGDNPKRLYNIAQRADTIAYEVLCAVSSRVIRLYV